MNPNTELRETATLLKLYSQTGPFLWSQHLRQLGSTSPVRTVFIIGKCLSGAFMAHPGWRAVGPGQPGDALVHVLGLAYELFARAPIEPLSDIEASVGKAGPWDARGVLAELMAVDLGSKAIRHARQRFRSAGLSVSFPELHDLSALFANVHLRAALRTFDTLRGEGSEAAWMNVVFYRYALRHVMARRRLEEVLPLSDEWPDLNSEPQTVLEGQAHEAMTQALPQLLAALPSKQRKALTLYFGFEGRERTVAEVAQALSTNVYFARSVLISGLGAIAASIGAAGILDEGELLLARAVFLEGRSLADVSQRHSLSQAEVRRTMAQISGKLQGALRRRTTVPKVQSKKREYPMTGKESDVELGAGELLQYASTKTGSLRASVLHGSVRLPHLSGAIAVQAARDMLSTHDALLAEASEDEEELLSEIYAPQPEELARTDLEANHLLWQQALDFAAAMTLDEMGPLMDLCQQQARAEEVAVEVASEQQFLERLRDSAAAVATALEQALPRTSRRDPGLVLAVDFADLPDRTLARWTTADWAGESIALFSLTRHRLGFVGGFKSGAADLIARCAIQILQEGSSPLLPGFAYAERRHSTDGELLLRWRAPAPMADPTTAGRAGSQARSDRE